MKSIPKIKMTSRQILAKLKQNNFDFLTCLYTNSGDICQTRVGFKRIIIINQPEYAKHVLHTNIQNYPKDNFYDLLEKIIGKNILTTRDMDYWSVHRKMIAGIFKTSNVEGMGAEIIDETKKFISGINTEILLCINTMTTKLSLQVIARLMFNSAITSEQTEKLTALLTQFSNLLIKKRQPFSLPFIPLFHPSFRKSHADFKQLIHDIINSIDSNDKDNFLSRLKCYTCPVSNAGLTDEELFSETAMMLFAGHETTANALTWLIITLSKYPTIRDKLQREIRRVLKHKHLEVGDLEKIPLVHAVVMEVLRLFPSIPAVPRNALKDDIIDDYHIPANAMVVINIAMIQRHPEYWSNPEGFWPERFINDKPNHKYSFLSFINGPRVCIGNSLALLELQIMTVLLLQKFTLNLLPGEDVRTNFIISLRTKNDVYAQAETILSDS